MDDLTFDKLQRAHHAASEAIQAVCDVMAVDRGHGTEPNQETAQAGAEGVKAAATTLREAAAIMLQAAQAIDGLAVLLETHPDEGRH